jgi:formylglycine-generating enzyme required for sulfatase activity
MKKLMLIVVILFLTINVVAQEEAQIDPKTWEPDISMVDLEALKASGEINDYRLPHEGADEKIVMQWIAAQMRQRDEAKSLGIPVEFTDQFGIEFVYVPSGSFVMGTNQTDIYEREYAHAVTISKGFYMSKCEVTQGLWKEQMRDHPFKIRSIMDMDLVEHESAGITHPVYNVNWSQANELFNRLSGKSNSRYRLPTEAEWEYSARAGTQTDFYWGSTSAFQVVDQYEWYSANAHLLLKDNYSDKYWNGPQPVGEKLPNAFGIHDLMGNVEEWCSDWFDKDYYRRSPKNDPKGAESSDFVSKRSENYISDLSKDKIFSRNADDVRRKASIIGIRIVREIK